MNTETESYVPWDIEAYWRERWAREQTYRTPTPGPGQKTYYCLDFFPYPSGAGLSVGHGRNYVPSDVIARYHRMRGEAVLHPMGWDAFGLPAENEAMKRGSHPAASTAHYAANYRHQLDLLGCSYDWEREFTSADPAFYRWNQHFFLMLYEKGLAYRAEAPVNWCESCQTVLAAEEIEDGNCWRCHNPVARRKRKQWYIRVTAYAEELYADLESLDWPEHILAMQRHWIGRSEGVEIQLQVESCRLKVKRHAASQSPITDYQSPNPQSAISNHPISVFTTRPDTFFGVTFVALAPEHPLAESITVPEQREAVRAYIREAENRSDLERHTREPDGVPTGAYAVLPGGERVPIFVADYVLAEHGSGAIMGVPAHDTRDFIFAQKYNLPVKVVIVPPEGVGTGDLPYTEAGVMVNSGDFDGMDSVAAQDAIADWLATQGNARRAVHYRLHDWLVSRQRYWGTPIPIIHCPACGEVPVPVDDLPVTLPALPDYRPRGDGKSPLANLPYFVNVACPRCGGPAERETDTLTGFVCSSWYYLRFVDPYNAERPFDPAKVSYWLPVDVYVGGAEHAVGHLMYARFWTKMLADAGLVDFREPLPVLRSQGVLHARDPETGRPVRMSKSRGNVVAPEDVIARYGADVTRLHLMFMGPFEANVVWETEDDGTTPQHIEGVRRFLQRVWRVGNGEWQMANGESHESRITNGESQKIVGAMHRTIREVTEEVEGLRFNKAISALMTFTNGLEAYRRNYGDTPDFVAARATLLKLLAPFAPFIAEELWQRTGGQGSIHHQAWPAWDEALAQAQTVEIAVQINGKVRARISIDADADEEVMREAALATPVIQQMLAEHSARRIIAVPGRLVNVVV
ncbi:MAG: leucine--tRNA ligase [Anaerolineae bacterium]